MGVDFFWTLETMLRPTLLVSGILLLLFYVIDRLAWNQEPAEVKGKKGVPRQVRIEGVHNVLYLAGVVGGGAGRAAYGIAAKRYRSALVAECRSMVWRATRRCWC